MTFWWSLAARQLDDVGDEPGQLVELRDDAVERRPALSRCHGVDLIEQLDIRAQAGERGAELVARVEYELPLLDQ